jgi:hypothetical protein
MLLRPEHSEVKVGRSQAGLQIERFCECCRRVGKLALLSKD